MMLTGKAKQDFDRYLDSISSVKMYPSILIKALIIDWLDSVGIIMETHYCPWTVSFECFLCQEHAHVSRIKFGSIDCGEFPTRQQATEAAIKLANDLYNGNK